LQKDINSFILQIHDIYVTVNIKKRKQVESITFDTLTLKSFKIIQ